MIRRGRSRSRLVPAFRGCSLSRMGSGMASIFARESSGRESPGGRPARRGIAPRLLRPRLCSMGHALSSRSGGAHEKARPRAQARRSSRALGLPPREVRSRPAPAGVGRPPRRRARVLCHAGRGRQRGRESAGAVRTPRDGWLSWVAPRRTDGTATDKSGRSRMVAPWHTDWTSTDRSGRGRSFALHRTSGARGVQE